MKMSEKQTGENESYVVLVVKERDREAKGCLRVCVMYEKLHEK